MSATFKQTDFKDAVEFIPYEADTVLTLRAPAKYRKGISVLITECSSHQQAQIVLGKDAAKAFAIKLLEYAGELDGSLTQNELRRLQGLPPVEEIKWCIAAYRIDNGALVYWHNDGEPTVWQPTVDEWKFEYHIAAEIAKSMQKFSFEEVRNVHLKELT